MPMFEPHIPTKQQQYEFDRWTRRECYEFYVAQRRRFCTCRELLNIWLRAPCCQSCALSDPLDRMRVSDISPSEWERDVSWAVGADTFEMIQEELDDDPDYALMCKRCGCELHPWRSDEVWVITYHLEEHYGIPLEAEGKKPPKGLRKLILSLYGHTCFGCGEGGELHIDHVLPQSKGGTAAFRNLQPLCETCGGKKDDSIPEEVEVFCDMDFSRCPSDGYEGLFW